MRTDEEMEELRKRLQYVNPKDNEPVRQQRKLLKLSAFPLEKYQKGVHEGVSLRNGI